MAGSPPPSKRRRTHGWRGVVEDFVDLDLEQHGYQCIWKHTDNLVRKLERPNVDVNAMVRKGVIPRLDAILAFPDRRNDAKLQHTAVRALGLIVRKSKEILDAGKVVSEGLVQNLLTLLRLRIDDLAYEVLLIVKKFVDEDLVTLDSVPGSMESLMEASKCAAKRVKHHALDLVISSFLDEIPSLEWTGRYLRDIIPQLRDTDEGVVSKTCEIVHILVLGDSHGLSLALIVSDILPCFVDILRKGATNEELEDAVFEVLSCINSLVNKAPAHVEAVIKSGLLNCLNPYVDTDHPRNRLNIQVQWILTHVVNQCNDVVLQSILKKKLVPSLEAICTVYTDHVRAAVTQLLTRLLQNVTFLACFLDAYLLDYIDRLYRSNELDNLRHLLEVFVAALQEIKTRDKFTEVSSAMHLSRRLERLLNLQTCPNETIRTLSEQLISIFLI